MTHADLPPAAKRAASFFALVIFLWLIFGIMFAAAISLTAERNPAWTQLPPIAKLK
jgi:hypothetical protein